MAEKILNTRIRLKYDSFSEWTSKNPTLLEGEIAIAYLAESKTEETTPDNGTHPVLFKVGPGAFNSLPWASALAADVYAWAKLTYDEFLVEIQKTFYTETEIDALIAKYSTTEQMNAAISAAEGRAATDAGSKADKALADAKAYTDTLRNDVSIPEGGFASKSDFDSLKAKVEDEDGALARANAAYELADAARTESEVNTQIDTKLNAYRTSAAQDAIDETKADKSVVEAMYTNTQIDGFVQNAAKAGTDAAAAVLGTASDAATANTVYGAKAAAAAAQSDATTAKTKIEAFLGTITPDGANDVIDTLAEVQAELDRLGDAVELEQQFATKADKVTGATNGNFAGLDANGNLTDSGKKAADFATAAQGAKADTAVQPAALDDYVKKQEPITIGDQDVETRTKITNSNITLTHNDKCNLTSITNTGFTITTGDGANSSHFKIDLGDVDTASGETENVSVEMSADFKDRFNEALGTEAIAEAAANAIVIPIVNDGKLTITGNEGLTGSGNFTANQAGNTTINVGIADKGVTTAKIADKGVTTAKIADHAVGAAQLKAEQGYAGEDAEIWIFDCGNASTHKDA